MIVDVDVVNICLCGSEGEFLALRYSRDSYWKIKTLVKPKIIYKLPIGLLQKAENNWPRR